MNDDEQRTLIDEVVTLSDMQQLRRHLSRLARQAGLPNDRAEEFVIAVHEAVINAIRHAGGRGEVAVVQDDQRRLIAEVSDAGPGTPRSITLTMPPTTAQGGRGLPLAGELADHIEVHSDRHGTTVRLEMSLPHS